MLITLRPVTLTVNLYWTMLESSLALIAACLPTMHVLLLRQRIENAFNNLRVKLGVGPPPKAIEVENERRLSLERRRKEKTPWPPISDLDIPDLDWSKLNCLEAQQEIKRVDSIDAM